MKFNLFIDIKETQQLLIGYIWTNVNKKESCGVSKVKLRMLGSDVSVLDLAIYMGFHPWSSISLAGTANATQTGTMKSGSGWECWEFISSSIILAHLQCVRGTERRSSMFWRCPDSEKDYDAPSLCLIWSSLWKINGVFNKNQPEILNWNDKAPLWAFM